MNHRIVKLLDTKSGITTGTTVIDLDMLDCISEIIIEHSTVNGADGDSTEHPMLNITGIEIIDGSDVLFSLEGPEAQALDIYNNGMYPRGGAFHYLNTLDAVFNVALSFGRHLWDESLALDPSKFNNPQLRITHNYALGGMNPSTCILKVMAALFDEKVISPVGFLMSKEIKQWNATANDHQYTDLPLDYPYRKLLLQNRIEEYDPRVIFANIKLASDGDKKVIVNSTFSELMWGIGRENAYIRETINAPGAVAQREHHCTPTVNVQVTANGFSEALGAKDIACFASGGGHLQAICEVANNIALHVAGWAPHGTLQIPFGKQDNPDDWFDVTRLGNLKLDITDGSAHGVSKVFLQQFRSY